MEELYKYLGITKSRCEHMGISPLKYEEGRLWISLNAEGEKYRSLVLHRAQVPVEIIPMGSEERPRIFSNDPVTFLDEIVLEAMEQKASDIHLEIFQEVFRVRIRVNGKLKCICERERSIYPSVLSRIKILSQLDISEKRLPQDGRFTFEGDPPVDIRVSIAPTIWGEKAVLRLLNKYAADYTLSTIGLTPEQRNFMSRLLEQPGGLVLFSGPTNSGKTTSIYALLQELNTMDKNIITIEDPVEYRLQGVNQIQINTKAKMDFNEGLRTVLRQDPDVLVIGEIRNRESATIALRAALTGILVFSTIHSEDSVSTIVRLREMGMEPYLIAEGLLSVISQRLIRPLCPYCKEEVTVHDRHFFDGQVRLYQGSGCPRCEGGYLGRKGFFEILPFDGQIRRAIYDGVDMNRLNQLCRGKKYTDLKTELRKSLEKGEISLSEAKSAIHTLY